MTPQERDREIRLAQAAQRRERDRFLREKPGQRAGVSVPRKDKSEMDRKESGGQQVAVF
jgi:hypothetical protein